MLAIESTASQQIPKHSIHLQIEHHEQCPGLSTSKPQAPLKDIMISPKLYDHSLNILYLC